MQRRKRLVLYVLLVFFLFVSGTFLIVFFLFPIPTSIRYSTIVEDKEGRVIHAFLSLDDKWRMRSELKDISPIVKKAIVAKEDKYFYAHPGVNPFSIIRAAFFNLVYIKKTSGASTITMQVVRLLQPKARTYKSKLLEMFQAFELEWRYSKDEIFLLYLNLVPYGGNIEGVKAASLLYFGKSPDQLSLAQAVALSIIPNRPNSLKPGSNNQRITEARNYWLRKLGKEGVFTTKEIAVAISEPFNAVRRNPPQEAPQFATFLKAKYPELPILRTTLSTYRQELAGKIAYNYMQRLKNRHISNAAVLVLNNKTHSVEAHIGSADFRDKAHAGQVNGVVAVRSPGSTLKPLVYGLAFDKGLLTPKSVVLDIPTDFNGYNPENFDKRFHGKVSVETSLAYSLNIPAVSTLREVGLHDFIHALKRSGFRSIEKNESSLGFSIILGGCGVTLAEITQLFSAFANYGKLYPVNYLIKRMPSNSSIQLLSPASAYMVNEILAQVTRPDLPNRFQSNYHVPKISWKTGTSYGRRDAWSIGYNRNYTVGVWVGNFSGEGVPELTGADIATPLLFDIFNAIDYNPSGQWWPQPHELGVRFVCQESGLVPEEFCEKTISDFYVPKISSSKKCSHLKYVWVSGDEQISYCGDCLPANGYKKKLYPQEASVLKDFYKVQNIPYQMAPRHNPYCTRVAENLGLKIISPAANALFYLDKDEPAELLLKCSAPYDASRLYWYIDDRFYREASVQEKVFFKAYPGKLKISCADDKGRHAHVSIQVVYAQ